MAGPDAKEARRVAIEHVRPTIDCGRFAVKRVVGDRVEVTADVFSDGHEVVASALRYRSHGETVWRLAPMIPLGNDAWRGELLLDKVGRVDFVVEGWIDSLATWLRDLRKWLEAGQDVSVDLAIGAELVGQATRHATGEEARKLDVWRGKLQEMARTQGRPTAADLDALAEAAAKYPDKHSATASATYSIIVDRQRARCSAWYEMFPRSTSPAPGRHGTFQDCARRLEYVAGMGFDVVYLPPIHPIGRKFRKGKNNALTAAEGEHGVPWAIGGGEGGHTALHPDLGTMADFIALRDAAIKHGMELALDIAFQCSPDHPYVREHPQWFRHRPDGTIQYAENPPKKYQDIYPFDFDTVDAEGLWKELTDVVLYWAKAGVRVFRVDNPHTKPFDFWEYLIGRVKEAYPETIFLAEAFTRPKIMYRLAKLGFTQSYTYFTWRNTKTEFIEYLTELTQTEVCEYFRPNLWTNTPDILPEHLQTGGRTAFFSRLVLAATLGANYGIYGPAYELCERTPREPGSEEYLDSEKYELRHWDIDRPDSLRDVITRVNRARRENAALQRNDSLRFHKTDNEQLLCYSKRDGQNVVIVVVNLNFHGEEHGHVELSLAELGLAPDQSFQLRDALTDATFSWQGSRNFVELDPVKAPAHLFRVEF